MNESEIPISPLGQIRQEEILSLAKRQARNRRHRRQGARIGVYLLLAAIISSLFYRPTRQQIVIIPKTIAPLPSAARTAPEAIITFIPPDPGIADRLSIHPTHRKWKWIGDDELLQTLASAGHPAGLISVHGQTILLPR